MARKRAQRDRGSPLTAVSLFSGSGGMDIGFLRAGFDVRLCIEKDPNAVATLRQNGFKRVWQADIADTQLVTPSSVLERARIKEGQVGLVIGGPPCQPFSQPGRRKGLGDPRAMLVYHFARLVAGLRPRAFVFENVSGIMTRPMKEAVDLLRTTVGRDGDTGADDGYDMEISVLNAADYGVPQLRNRTFIVGWRGAGQFYFPKATHYRPGKELDRENAPKLRRCPTVAEAFRGLPEPDAPSEQAWKVARTIEARNRKWHGK